MKTIHPTLRSLIVIGTILMTMVKGYTYEVKNEHSNQLQDTLQIQPSWHSNRFIVGKPQQPVALIGVYNKIVSSNDTIKDIYNSIVALNYPQADPSNFKKQSHKGFRILNLAGELYKNDQQFWEEYNLPWLQSLITEKTIIYVLSNGIVDQLRYQFHPFYQGGPFMFKHSNYNYQLMRTGFGRELEYLDSQIKEGTYKWNEALGAYEPIK